MHIATNVKKSSIPLLEADTYPARCVQFIDIGDQPSDDGSSYKRMCLLVFEIPSERFDVKLETGEVVSKPRITSKRFTFTMFENGNLRKAVNSWRGKALTEEEASDFDLSRLVGQPCMLSIIHKTSKNGNVYATIGNIAKFPKSFPPLPPAETPTFCFDLDTVEDIEKMPDMLFGWVQKVIEESPTYKELLKKKEDLEFQNISADDLPFGND